MIVFPVAALALVSMTSPPPPASANPIVVQGERDARSAATDYVDKIMPLGFQQQFGRFDDPICPKTIGVSDSNARQIVGRIRQVAAAARIATARADCDPNLLVIVVNDKKAMIDDIRRKRPLYVEDVGPDLLKRAADSDRPFASWQVSRMEAADGMPIAKSDSMPGSQDGTNDPVRGPSIDGDYSRVVTTAPPSRLRFNAKPRVNLAVVIVEARALANVSTRQLADFALVRAVIPNDHREAAAPPSSILRLFEPGVAADTGPQSVTWWDVAFLKALADTPSDIDGDLQRHEVRDKIVTEMTRHRDGG